MNMGKDKRVQDEGDNNEDTSADRKWRSRVRKMAIGTSQVKLDGVQRPADRKWKSGHPSSRCLEDQVPEKCTSKENSSKEFCVNMQKRKSKRPNQIQRMLAQKDCEVKMLGSKMMKSLRRKKMRIMIIQHTKLESNHRRRPISKTFHTSIFFIF